MPIETGESFIIIKADLVDPLVSPTITVSGMSLFAAQNILFIAAAFMYDQLPNPEVVLATDAGDVHLLPAGTRLDPSTFEDEDDDEAAE